MVILWGGAGMISVKLNVFSDILYMKLSMLKTVKNQGLLSRRQKNLG